jgi:hypothetical protein
MDLWSGNIELEDGSKIDDINIYSESANDAVCHISTVSLLQFVAVVRISELPLSLVAGPSYAVWTQNDKSQEWFSDVLLQEPDIPNETTSWFDTSRESYAGVLAGVTSQISSKRKVTDILFYGVIDENRSAGENKPVFLVRALPLSTAQLDSITVDGTSPVSRDSSPHLDEKGVIYGRFIDQDTAVKTRGRKRPTAADIFDAANELRRRIKGKGGAGISQVAAGLSQSRPAGLQKLSLDIPASKKRIQPDQKALSAVSATFAFDSSRKHFARNPSLSGATKTHNAFEVAERQKLERTKSLPNNPASSSLEQMNRDAISNLVLKGMRVYGFQPKKKLEKDAETQADSVEDEYKLVYHQTFKAAVFAFVGVALIA